VGMEASGHARWFERLLAELNLELWVGEAAEIRTRRVRKQRRIARMHSRVRMPVCSGSFPSGGPPQVTAIAASH
jgi:hypothetical protein